MPEADYRTVEKLGKGAELVISIFGIVDELIECQDGAGGEARFEHGEDLSGAGVDVTVHMHE